VPAGGRSLPPIPVDACVVEEVITSSFRFSMRDTACSWEVLSDDVMMVVGGGYNRLIWWSVSR